MKTLIFNGSPRKHGDTAALLEIFKENITGDICQIDTFFCGIQPCNDCRYCMTHPSCAITDEMRDLFARIDEADNLVIASPLYFSELSGSMLQVLSRLQYLYTAKRFRNERVLTAQKRRGVILLTGGGDGSPAKAIDTATCLLRLMGASVVGTVCSHQTDQVPAKDDLAAIDAVTSLAAKLTHG